MKTLQQTSQKTKNYNPKKANSAKKASEPKNGLTAGFGQGNFLWTAYLSTREGTFAEHLKTISLVTLRRYAQNGCHRAKLILEKFEKFVQTCQMQIGQELLSPQTQQNTTMNQTSSNKTQKETTTTPSYDQCRLSAFAAYSMKVRLMAEKRAAQEVQGLLAHAA